MELWALCMRGADAGTLPAAASLRYQQWRWSVIDEWSSAVPVFFVFMFLFSTFEVPKLQKRWLDLMKWSCAVVVVRVF